MLYEIITMVVLVVLGAVFYRWRGSDEASVPALVANRTVRRVLFALVLSCAGVFVTGSIYGAVTGVVAFYGIIMGHGSYFPTGIPVEDNEAFAWLTRRLSSPMTENTKLIGMCLTGLAMTVPIGISLAVVSGSLFPLVYALVGTWKGAVYWLTPNTEHAEYWWGGVAIFWIIALKLVTAG